MLDYPILSLLIWVPMVAGVMVLSLGNSATAKYVAFLGSFIGFILVIPLWNAFDLTSPGMQFVEFNPLGENIALLSFNLLQYFIIECYHSSRRIPCSSR